MAKQELTSSFEKATRPNGTRLGPINSLPSALTLPATETAKES